MAYSGITTKVRAMSAKLLKEKDYDTIAGLGTVTEAIEYLKDKTAYAPYVERMDVSLYHRGNVEKILYQSLFDDYSRIFRFAGMEQKTFLKLYWKRYEVDLINYCLRIVFNHYEKPFDLEYKKEFFDRYSQISIDRLITSKNIDELVDNLRDTEYYGALARIRDSGAGTLFDYDLALDIDPNNFIGHYNRGLLRAQVGDDNRAIEDFNFVLEMEPDNMMATFNRGLLRAQTGDYRGAIEDYTTVINQYPNFLAGYYQRAEARKKIGDRKGAEADEFKVMKAQLDRQNGVSKNDVAQNDQNKEDDNEEDEGKTRKKSDKNMNNYRKIVIADDSEQERQYKSDYRGRVQDRNVTIKPEPLFALTYYEKMSDVKRSVNYHTFIDELNQSGIFPKRLRITNMEAPLTEEQVKFHFALIDAHTSAIVEDEKSAAKRFARALDFYLVQDFASSMDDLTQAILLDDKFFPAYFMRSLVRCKQLEYQKAEEAANAKQGGDGSKEIGAIDYDVVKADLDKVIALAPDFVYAYYNRANVLAMLKDYRAALVDYDKAIDLNHDFADAYFNRGLTHIFLGNNKQGITDLSKAGELGIVSAYNIIKRFTDQGE